MDKCNLTSLQHKNHYILQCARDFYVFFCKIIICHVIFVTALEFKFYFLRFYCMKHEIMFQVFNNLCLF